MLNTNHSPAEIKIESICQKIWRCLLSFISIRREEKARFLYLEVTHRCNLKCITCYTGAGIEKEKTLTFEEHKSVIRQAREIGVRRVSLSGSGEPLLYRNLLPLIDYIREMGMEVVMFTNGTLIDEAMASELIARQVTVYFKLYSLEPAIFDEMVGRQNAYRWVEYTHGIGDQKKTWQIPSGLKALLDAQQAAGRTGLVKTEALITKLNIDSLPDVADFCKNTGIDFFPETPVFTGKAMQNYKKIAASADEYEKLYQRLVAILGENYMAALRDSRCPVENNPVVWTDGSIGLCSSRPADIGNVRDEPLAELFRKAKAFKMEQDSIIEEHAKKSRFFHTCHSRQYCQWKNHLPCNY